MTGSTQYAYMPKHHRHLFTHTTFSGWALQAAVSWHQLTQWTQRQLQKFTYKNKSSFANIKKKKIQNLCFMLAEYPKY